MTRTWRRGRIFHSPDGRILAGTGFGTIRPGGDRVWNDPFLLGHAIHDNQRCKRRVFSCIAGLRLPLLFQHQRHRFYTRLPYCLDAASVSAKSHVSHGRCLLYRIVDLDPFIQFDRGRNIDTPIQKRFLQKNIVPTSKKGREHRASLSFF